MAVPFFNPSIRFEYLDIDEITIHAALRNFQDFPSEGSEAMRS